MEARPLAVTATERRVRRKDTSRKTSLEVFRAFLLILPDGSLDASRIISRECYNSWLSTRRKQTTDPERTFQRTLSSHLTAVDGRAPFSEAEEAAILHVLRRGTPWPCFDESEVRFGCTGFRARGYHEKRKYQAPVAERVDDDASFRKQQRLSPGDDEQDDDVPLDERGVTARGTSFMRRSLPLETSSGSMLSSPSNRLVRAVQQLFSSYSTYSWELWQRGGLLVRLMVLGSGSTHDPTMENAHELMQNM